MRFGRWVLGLALLLLLAVPLALPRAEPESAPTRRTAATPPVDAPADADSPVDSPTAGHRHRPVDPGTITVRVLPPSRPAPAAPSSPPPTGTLPVTGPGGDPLLLGAAAVLLTAVGVVALVLAAEPRYHYRGRHHRRR